MKDKLTVDEINIALQEAAEDVEDMYEGPIPVPINFTGLELDGEEWDEYIARILDEGPPLEEV